MDMCIFFLGGVQLGFCLVKLKLSISHEPAILFQCVYTPEICMQTSTLRSSQGAATFRTVSFIIASNWKQTNRASTQNR